MNRARLTAFVALAFVATSCDACKKKAESPETVRDRGGPPTAQLPAENSVARVVVRCDKSPGAPSRSHIDPAFVGVAFADAAPNLYARAHRWGGNTTSRYNFILGDAWNTGSDWFYRNVEVDSALKFMLVNAVKTQPGKPYIAITVPMIGWVAKDKTSGSFPVSRFGKQEKVAPERTDLGNGKTPDGKEMAPGEPTIANVAVGPADVAAWVAKIEKEAGDGSTREYILDNEPSLWNSTHRDVHPDPETYDEIIEKTLAYAREIRSVAPNAVIAGPAEWGWPGYFYSAKDAKSGFSARPDRRAHGDEPKLVYYIKKLAAEEKRTGEKLVDVIDLHFYPQAKGVQGPDGEGGDGGGDTDPETNARRLRSTRALWDPSYVDESYVDEAIALIPRVEKIIDAENPRLGFQIGEWNFGGERDISGALALAEALGRMAEGGVTHAFYWKTPKQNSPAWFGMRAFTSYDGNGASFYGQSLATSAPVGVSAFAARRDDGVLVLVLLNFDGEKPREIRATLTACASPFAVRRFEYDGTHPLIAQKPLFPDDPDARSELDDPNKPLSLTLPKSSITVLELRSPRDTAH